MLVLKIPCSRCARIDEQSITPDKAAAAMDKNRPPDLYLRTGDGEEFTFNRLCQPCKSIVGRLLSQAFTPLENRKSSVRTAKGKDPSKKTA